MIFTLSCIYTMFLTLIDLFTNIHFVPLLATTFCLLSNDQKIFQNPNRFTTQCQLSTNVEQAFLTLKVISSKFMELFFRFNQPFCQVPVIHSPACCDIISVHFKMALTGITVAFSDQTGVSVEIQQLIFLEELPPRMLNVFCEISSSDRAVGHF